MWKGLKQSYEDTGYSKADFDKQYSYLSKEKEWSGFMGVTLHPSVPENFKGYGKSTSGNHQIIMNARASEKKQTSTQAHEAYGHQYFYILGKWHSHGTIKSLTSDAPNNNRELEIQIYNREKEAEQNYEKH